MNNSIDLTTDPAEKNFIVMFGNEALVTLNRDGTIIYAENYNPDKATKLFWETIASSPDNPCNSCPLKANK